ncbi:hypothetical protein SAMN05216355_10339 [Actinomyces ruminicola]|uniref:Uncharacterized protein n=1 Tax=Actinomyces ruminicola TaxID=332524 RepID=A0A1H0B2C4_9ACTO|nr:hypothetical protein [Actinomyces ruminicola]SDN39766.1 hypothetical protein SAMN05216355_10339 [Actinomyces ruminicola]
MKKAILAVVLNVVGVLLGVFSLMLLEGAIELAVEGGADAAAAFFMLPLAAILAAVSLGMLWGCGRLRA